MTDYTTNNAAPVAGLLRAMSPSSLGHGGRNLLFNAAADICEMHVAIMKELEDVPGETALERVQRLKEWYRLAVEYYNAYSI
jgi:hypothetical protein